MAHLETADKTHGQQMCDTGQLLALARRFRVQADQTHLPIYAMRFRQAAGELEAFVNAHRRHAERAQGDGRSSEAIA